MMATKRDLNVKSIVLTDFNCKEIRNWFAVRAGFKAKNEKISKNKKKWLGIFFIRILMLYRYLFGIMHKESQKICIIWDGSPKYVFFTEISWLIDAILRENNRLTPWFPLI